jgi:hypothetical protein
MISSETVFSDTSADYLVNFIALAMSQVQQAAKNQQAEQLEQHQFALETRSLHKEM